MGILLKEIRIYKLRGLKNISIDLEQSTVFVGVNNAGKSTILKALELALTNSYKISDDDFYYSEVEVEEEPKIIIDLLFISVDREGAQTDEFEPKWIEIFTDERITFDSQSRQNLAFRTELSKDPILPKFNKMQLCIDLWPDFKSGDTNWYEQSYTRTLSFVFDEIPFFYLDANRDILEDIKYKTSYLGRILSEVRYNKEETQKIEDLIKKLNREAISTSRLLSDLKETLEDLDTTIDNPNSNIDITPFSKKVKDISKGVEITYSNFSMEYHGMGTRSWSSLLVLKAFIKQAKFIAESNELVYNPIVAIEEPESHLHPNAQKKLYSQMKDIIGQKIISTHSTYIAGEAALNEIRSLIKVGSDTYVGKMNINDSGEIDQEGIRKIEREVLNTRGDIFFSKVIILCEGETEEQALPILMEKYFTKSIVELGINIIGVDGGGNYYPFLYLADRLGIKWYIFSDGEDSILHKIKKDYCKLKNINDDSKDIEFPNNIIYLENNDNFESYLIRESYTEEIEECIKTILNIDDLSTHISTMSTKGKRKQTDKKCSECNQFIYENEVYNYQGEDGRNKALLRILIDTKTSYAPILAKCIVKSRKGLPSKIKSLCVQVQNDLNR